MNSYEIRYPRVESLGLAWLLSDGFSFVGEGGARGAMWMDMNGG